MKKSNFIRRLLCLTMAAVMLLSLLAGCNPTDNTTGTATNTPGATTTGTTKPSAGPAEGQVLYTITAKGQGGMLLPGVSVTLTDIQGNEVNTGVTDETGVYSVWMYPAAYTARISNGLKDGYTAVETALSAEGGAFDVIANTAVITDQYPNQPKSYNVGDVMYDFEFVNTAGEKVRLSQLLQTKKLVVINFWATWCGPCKKEFPAMQEAYEAYGDDVEIVAFSTSDSADKCDAFREENGYTFTMIPDIGLYSRFSVFSGGASIPTTVMVDRYGVVVDGTSGYVDSAAVWKAEMEFYTSDDYNQTGKAEDPGDDDPVEQEKPNVTMTDTALIEAAVNDKSFTGSYWAPADEYTWPWVLSEDGKAIEPSNYGKNSTSAMISTTVNMKQGQVFAFDYEYSIEYDEYGMQIYDLFAVYVDGHAMQKMYKKQDGKVTCYAYTPETEGEHTITLVYTKDASDDWVFMENEKEYVRVNNIRMISVEDMAAAGAGMNVWVAAADTVAEESASTSYLNYATVVLGDDGYYHVGTKTGPLLLAKLTGETQWSSTSLEVLGYNGYLKIDGVNYYDMIGGNGRSYCWLESYSDLGYSVVDETLADMLSLFAEKVGDGKNHEWEWLEFCSYFLHYGAGEGITRVTDVRRGIDKASAFTAQLGANYVYVNQTLVPRGLYYKFIPEKDGVYKFYSVSEGGSITSSSSEISTEAWFWNTDVIYDEYGYEVYQDESNEGDTHFLLFESLKAGQTYYISVAFSGTEDLGQFYFNVEYMGEDDGSFDVMTACTKNYTSDLTTGEFLIWRNYDIHAALGSDGYYHQVLADGSLDYSEHGYIYVDFLNVTDMTSFIGYKGGYATLQKLIENGYAMYDPEDEKALILVPGTFDFTTRNDIEDEQWRQELGNHQAEMEAYLAQAISGEPTDFDYGYVKADENLVHILNDLISLHGENGVADQWLMFCRFAKHPNEI